MKNGKTSSSAKAAPKLVPSAAEAKLSSEKRETACASGPDKSAKSYSKEAAEICALLRPDLLEDMDACAEFVDGVKGIIGPGSFVKHTPEYRRAALLTMMQKRRFWLPSPWSLIKRIPRLPRGWRGLWLLKLTPWPRKLKDLESELAALKGSNVSAPTSLQLETARQEITNLKARLDAVLSSLGQWSPGLPSWRRISSWAAR